MPILIPYLGQPYSCELSKAVAYDLIKQNPMTISYSIEKIAATKASKISTTWLNRIIPPWSSQLNKFYKDSNNKDFSVGNFSLCRRLVQFLLWSKYSKAKDLGDINGYEYEIRLDKIPIENVNLVQLLLKSYCNSLVLNEDYLNNECSQTFLRSLNSDQAEYIFKYFAKPLLSESTKNQALKELNPELGSNCLTKSHDNSLEFKYICLPKNINQLKSSLKLINIQLRKLTGTIKKK